MIVTAATMAYRDLGLHNSDVSYLISKDFLKNIVIDNAYCCILFVILNNKFLFWDILRKNI